MQDVPYTELVPPPDLAAFVDRFWVRRASSSGPGVHRVLPDGCVDLMLDPLEGTAHLVGTMTRALVVPARAGYVVAARFRPGVAASFVGQPLVELTDLRVDAADVGLELGGVLEGAAREGSLRTAIDVLSCLLRQRLSGARPDRLVVRAVARLSEGTHGSVDALAKELGVTRQHLARRFRHEVGVGPKELARIARMQRAVTAIERGRADFARLAVEQGYADQSHLVHELQALVGLGPARLREEAEPMRALAHLFSA